MVSAWFHVANALQAVQLLQGRMDRYFKVSLAGEIWKVLLAHIVF